MREQGRATFCRFLYTTVRGVDFAFTELKKGLCGEDKNGDTSERAVAVARQKNFWQKK